MVTGGAGYIGSVLVPMLLARSYGVRIVDTGWFGVDHVHPDAELIVDDILDFDRCWLDGIDAVVHLAGLSNDPMAAFSPSLNYILNASGPAIVAQAAKEAGIRRFVFASSCSVYGFDDAIEVDEDHAVRPAFPYAISKLMAERLLACLEDSLFRPIILRKGTVVGWSPRMRFDLVTNAMIKSAVTDHRIVVHNPDLWRPLIDVQDAALAYLSALQADISIAGIFNIAHDNYSVGALAEEVAAALGDFGLMPELQIEHRRDVRSYRVDVGKAYRAFGFRADRTVSQTVRDVMCQLQSGPVLNLNDSRYYNIAQMKKLAAQKALPWLGERLREEMRPAAVGA